jgi:hypothetical protein
MALPIEGIDQHQAALRILRQRGIHAPTAEEYLEAVTAAEAGDEDGLRSDILQQALEQLGEPMQELVTEQMLNIRQREILTEAGFFMVEGDSVKLPSEAEQLDAMLTAIEELGKPGETRKDLAESAAAVRDRIIDSAVVAGKIPTHLVDVWRDTWDRQPAIAAKTIAAIEPNPAFVELIAGDEDHAILPDADGMQLHVRAEAIIGKADYTEDEYVAALHQGQRELDAAAESQAAA